MSLALARRLTAIRSVPAHIVALTAAASFAGQLVAYLAGWPLWVIVGVALLPWIPLFAFETAWMYRHYGFLALFFVLVVTQGGHFTEHVAQMVQIHLLDKAPSESHGIFGQLDIEWVHFVWNSWILVAVGALLYRFRGNPWLWATLAIAVWHEVEHVAIMADFLRTDQPGDPGLLAEGGAIGGGVGLIRPDLHFLYNLVETAPMAIAFVWQLRHTYDEWLARALPLLSEPQLVETTNRLATLRFKSGEEILRQGDAADRFYVVSRGEVEIIRDGRELARLSAGQFFGEIGLLAGIPRTATVRAVGDVELLALDRESFRRVAESSAATAESLEATARARLAAAPTLR